LRYGCSGHPCADGGQQLGKSQREGLLLHLIAAHEFRNLLFIKVIVTSKISLSLLKFTIKITPYY
jgi:hypothetical protein